MEPKDLTDKPLDIIADKIKSLEGRLEKLEGIKTFADLCQPVLQTPNNKWFSLKTEEAPPSPVIGVEELKKFYELFRCWEDEALSDRNFQIACDKFFQAAGMK